MSRPGYRRELYSFGSLPFATALIEGSVISVLAKLYFDVSDFGFATILAAPMFANVTSGVWARLVRGRPKALFLAGIQFLLMLTIGSIALLPANAWGAGVLVGLVVVGRCLIAGMINVRSIIWRANYRREMRAQITGRFTVIMTLLLAAVPYLAYEWLNDNPNRFRLIYPAGAAIGLISVIAVSRLRVRRERSLLDDERNPHAKPPEPPESPDPPGSPSDDLGEAGGPAAASRDTFFQILRRDRLFRSYMTWQFVAGMSNMAGSAAVVRLIVALVEEQNPDAAYGRSALLTTTLPLVMMTLSIPLWARFFDGVHIVRFRVRQGVLWIVSQSLYLLAGLAGTPLAFVVPRMFQGVVYGGGTLAWQLGHHDFADRRLAATYMGIHQTLTGVRGAVAPYLGVLLLTGWGEDAWGVHKFGLPSFAGIGPWVFALTAAGSAVAWLGFMRLAGQVERDA